MIGQRNTARRPTAANQPKRVPLSAQLTAILLGGGIGAVAIFAVLWVTVLPAFGLLYLLGWLP